MWTCPKCGAINYDAGSCGCCGYNGRIVIWGTGSSSDPVVKKEE